MCHIKHTKLTVHRCRSRPYNVHRTTQCAQFTTTFTVPHSVHSSPRRSPYHTACTAHHHVNRILHNIQRTTHRSEYCSIHSNTQRSLHYKASTVLHNVCRGPPRSPYHTACMVHQHAHFTLNSAHGAAQSTARTSTYAVHHRV